MTIDKLRRYGRSTIERQRVTTRDSSTSSAIYGLLAEFDSADRLLAAAQRAYTAGYRKMDAYTPFPVHGLDAALGVKPTKLPLLVLIGGIIGGAGAFFMQFYGMAIDYPYNVGGRPLNSWPAFIPITFELTVLIASFVAVIGMIALNGLPQPYHPVFTAPRFADASSTAFFLCIEAADPTFDHERTKAFLSDLGASEVTAVTG